MFKLGYDNIRFVWIVTAEVRQERHEGMTNSPQGLFVIL